MQDGGLRGTSTCSHHVDGTVPDVVSGVTTAVTGVVGRQHSPKLLGVTRDG